VEGCVILFSVEPREVRVPLPYLDSTACVIEVPASLRLSCWSSIVIAVRCQGPQPLIFRVPPITQPLALAVALRPVCILAYVPLSLEPESWSPVKSKFPRCRHYFPPPVPVYLWQVFSFFFFDTGIFSDG